MVVSDPISDMLTRIRNANMAQQQVVQVPHSKVKGEIARLLKDEGFIKDYKVKNDGSKAVMNMFLKYMIDRVPVIQGVRRISKPSRRRYVGAEEVPHVLGGIGVALLSTSSGIMTDSVARKQNIGGEVLCYIW